MPSSSTLRTLCSTYQKTFSCSSYSYYVPLTPIDLCYRTMATSVPKPRDPSTLSNYNYFRTTHTTTNFTISFSDQNLVGNVLLKLKSITDARPKDIVLDTSYLDIRDVKVDGKATKWEVLPRAGALGSPLKIQLDTGVDNGDIVDVDVGTSNQESQYVVADFYCVHRYPFLRQTNVQHCNGSRLRKHQTRSIRICVRLFNNF